MTRAVRALAVLAAGLLLLSGCGFNGGSGGYVQGNGVIRELSISQRNEVGTVAGTTLTGQHFALSSLRGKVVVVNIWGSWCAPCRSEATKLQSAYASLTKTYGNEIAFMGIDTQDPSPDNGLAFERTFGVTYPSLYDYGGDTLLAFHGQIAPNAIPSTLVLDKEGRIAASVSGPLTTSVTLEDLVQDVITGKANG